MDVTQAGVGLGPVRPLNGVHFGSTVAELRAVRPGIRASEYVGFADSSESFSVVYRFDRTISPRWPPIADRLAQVELFRDFDFDAIASDYWTTLVKQASVKLGSPSCSRFGELLGGAIAANWQSAEAALSIRLWPTRSEQSGNPKSQPRVALVLTEKPVVLRPRTALSAADSITRTAWDFCTRGLTAGKPTKKALP